MKTAVAGIGVIGRVHVEVLRELGHAPAAVCDVIPERRESVAGAKGYGDFSEMLEKERPDVVHICTPHMLHADMIVEALGRDINVLCEKPLCIKAEDIPRILEAEKNSRGMLGVCLQNRYNASSLFAKSFFEKKKPDFAFGSVLWHRDAAYYATGEWRGKWATEGGGVLINQAIHTVDLLQWICGDPESVTGEISLRSLKEVIEVEDTAFLRGEGESPFEVFATNTASVDMPVELRFASKGEVLTVLPDGATLNGAPVDLKREGTWYGKRQYGSGHAKLIADFYDHIARKEKFPLDGREGARAVKTVLAVYAAAGH